MASRKIEDLTPEVQEKCQNVINWCKFKNVNIQVYCTLRSLQEQSILYRQSRSRAEIDGKIKSLKNRGFDFLSDILEKVGPQNGPHVTNAGPGESWHNFGMAFDSVPIINNKAIWDINHIHWKVYGESVEKFGLMWGGKFKSLKDYPHAQLGDSPNPLTEKSPDEIREILIKNGLLKK